VNKEHPCNGCHVTIGKGELAINVSGKDRLWYSDYFCFDCSAGEINAIPVSCLKLQARLLVEQETIADFMRSQREGALQ